MSPNAPRPRLYLRRNKFTPPNSNPARRKCIEFIKNEAAKNFLFCIQNQKPIRPGNENKFRKSLNLLLF
jgi:hypothetical protein